MKTTIRVAIFDGHDLFREGITSLIRNEHGLELVGEASTGDEAVKRCTTAIPHVMIVGITPPETDVISFTHAVRTQAPKTRILVTGSAIDQDFILDTFRAGAHGCISRESAAETFFTAIRSIALGRYYCDHIVARALIKKILSDLERLFFQKVVARQILTTREGEVLNLMREDMTVEQISRELGISTKTVENHRSNIRRKLQEERSVTSLLDRHRLFSLFNAMFMS